MYKPQLYTHTRTHTRAIAHEEIYSTCTITTSNTFHSSAHKVRKTTSVVTCCSPKRCMFVMTLKASSSSSSSSNRRGSTLSPVLIVLSWRQIELYSEEWMLARPPRCHTVSDVQLFIAASDWLAANKPKVFWVVRRKANSGSAPEATAVHGKFGKWLKALLRHTLRCTRLLFLWLEQSSPLFFPTW